MPSKCVSIESGRRCVASSSSRRDEAIPLMGAARQPAEDDTRRRRSASAQALNVRLRVEKTASAAGRNERRAFADEFRRVRYVLDDFEASDDVERPSFGDEVFNAGNAIVDGDGLCFGVRLRDCDIAFGWIDGGNGRAHACQRLGDEAAAAADIDGRQTRKRPQGLRVAAEPVNGGIADEGQARWADLVKGAEFASRIPPFGRQLARSARLVRCRGCGLRRQIAAVRSLCSPVLGRTRQSPAHLVKRLCVRRLLPAGFRLLRGGARAANKRRTQSKS